MICLVKVTSGELYKYLKDIELYGRITEDGRFVIYGCTDDQEKKLYDGVFDYDKATADIHGWETVKDVEKWWCEGADECITLQKGEFEPTGKQCKDAGGAIGSLHS